MGQREGRDPSSPLIHLPPRFEDDRGYIQPLVDEPIGSAQLITAKRGSVRGNHRHRTDWHYCFVVSGEMVYHWREQSSGEVLTIPVAEGQMVFSPPMTDHAFTFPTTDAVFLALARNPRDQTSYEAEITRVDLLGSE